MSYNNVKFGFSGTPFSKKLKVNPLEKYTSFADLSSRYSRLSLSRSRKDPLKHFEISVLRHIRFAELRKWNQSNNKFHK